MHRLQRGPANDGPELPGGENSQLPTAYRVRGKVHYRDGAVPGVRRKHPWVSVDKVCHSLTPMGHCWQGVPLANIHGSVLTGCATLSRRHTVLTTDQRLAHVEQNKFWKLLKHFILIKCHTGEKINLN